MGDAPKKIYAGPNSKDVWGWPDASMFPDPPRCVTPYIHEDECKAREDAAYKRGMEEAAKICDRRAESVRLVIWADAEVQLEGAAEDIRAQIQERDDE